MPFYVVSCEMRKYHRRFHDRMLAKARKLVRNGRVERLDGERFNVIGDHGTYNVVERPDGGFSCSCPGFRDKGRCSHSTAVNIMLGKTRR
jgi:hypothetical protein